MMPLLSTSIALSQLLADSPDIISTVGNVNIIKAGDSSGSGDPLALCYLPYLQPFTAGGDGVPWNAIGQYEGLAAALLAMEHLNTGNGTIVPELDGIDQRCPLRFLTKAFDTELQQSVAVNKVINLTDRSRTYSGYSIDGETRKDLLPCAIIGAAASGVSIPTSIISSIRGFPQISPISTSARLDDKEQYKLFGRTIPNDDGTAIPLLAKLKSWNVSYVAVLHTDNDYGNAFAKGITLGAQREAQDMHVETVDINPLADDESISEAIRQLKQTEFTFFFGIISPSELVDKVMIEAYNQGIAGTGLHTWLFSDSVGSTAIGRPFEVGSPLERAFRGSGVLSAVGGVPGMGSFEKLAMSIQEMGESEGDRSYFDALLPVVNHSVVTGHEDFLKTPGLMAPFVYDAVVALGLASCELVETSAKDEYFSGEELFGAFLNTTFEGTSGSVILDRETGTRDPRSALFSLTNFIVDGSVDNGSVQFKGVQTDLFVSGGWESLIPYTFNDDTNGIPLDLPVLETNRNYLSTGLKVFGLTLCGIIIALAIGFSCWTYYNSKRRVVRASQPIFLYIISAGTLLMGLAIVPVTIDLAVADGGGADIACMAIPWLLAIGFSLVFSALFTKTYRINQLMHSASRCKRMKLTAVDVMKPLVTLLMLNVVVLTVWTVIDPLQHQTILVTWDDFFRDTETYGICSSEHAYIFVTILSVINIGCLCFALLQAYKARKLSTELQESSYIFIAMALIILVSFIGIPVIIIARENVSANYFVVVGLIFVICVSILLLIYVPKILALKKTNRNTCTNSRGPANQTLGRSSNVESTEGIEILNIRSDPAELENEIQQLKQLLVKERRASQEMLAIHDNNDDDSWHSTAEIELAPKHMNQIKNLEVVDLNDRDTEVPVNK